MVPTRRFWLLAALGIPLGALAAQAGSPLFLVAYNLALVTVAWATTKLAPSGKELRVRRRFDPVLSVRTQNRVVVELENDGAEDLRGVVRDEPPPVFGATRKEFPLRLAPGRALELEYSLTPFERGSDYFRGTYLRVECPLGLVVKQLKLNTEQPVRVYPNILALKEFDLLKQQGRLREIGIRRSRLRGLGTEFESLRDYTQGDDYRKIDWKASARRGKVVVKQFEQERNQSVIICVDIGRLMLSEVYGVRKLDHALDSLLMLAHAASLAGDFVGLLVYADTVRRYIPPRKGRNQLGFIIEAIHDLVAEPVETDTAAAMSYLSAKWKRRSLLVCFTDVDDEDQARSVAQAFGPLARRHLPLVVRVSDGRLKELADRPLASLDDMYGKAAAVMLQSDRRAADAVLASAQIHSLESEPQDLAASLVSFYFMVKERSLL
jgi:uncharacterized protein (DUF58 family)